MAHNLCGLKVHIILVIFTKWIHLNGQFSIKSMIKLIINNQCEYFHQLKNGLKSVIFVFCCSVSVGKISLHFQTFILPLIIIIQRMSDNRQRSDLIIISLSGITWGKKLRQTKSRRTVATSPRHFKKPSYKTTWKLCTSAPRAKNAHTKCWFNLVNRS